MNLPEVVQPGQIFFIVSICSNASCLTSINHITLPDLIYYKITLPSKYGQASILKVSKISFLLKN